MYGCTVFSYISFLTQELSKTYPQNFCMSPNLFKLAWMKDPYGYMNLPEYGFPQGPYSPARAISKIGVYFGSKFSNCHIGLGFNLRSISFNVQTRIALNICPRTQKFKFSKVCFVKKFLRVIFKLHQQTIKSVPYFFLFYTLKCQVHIA